MKKIKDDYVLYSDRNKDLLNNLNKILGALGLAHNAGALAIGNEAVTQAISRGTARIVFITKDISQNSMDKLLQKLIYTQTKHIFLPCDMTVLSDKLGKSGLVSAVALTRPGFEKIIFKCMDAASAMNNTQPTDNNTEVQ